MFLSRFQSAKHQIWPGLEQVATCPPLLLPPPERLLHPHRGQETQGGLPARQTSFERSEPIAQSAATVPPGQVITRHELTHKGGRQGRIEVLPSTIV